MSMQKQLFYALEASHLLAKDQSYLLIYDLQFKAEGQGTKRDQ